MEDDLDKPSGEEDISALMARFGLFANSLRTALEGEETGLEAGNAADAWLFGEEYLIDPEEKTLLLLIRPTFDIGNRSNLTALSEGARRIAGEIEAAEKEGKLSISFTGDVENEADEERAISYDIFYPTLFAILFIILLFLFSFRKKRAILFAVIALAVGILYDLAFAALTVQKLNMITSSFGALLVGLGIDFGIHLASRYDEAAAEGKKREEILGEVFAQTGLPILIGGITTAAAFYYLLLYRTIAFRQIGLFAGTGIITTLLATFTILPALLSVFPGKGFGAAASGREKVLRYELPFRAGSLAGKYPFPIIFAGALLTLAAGLLLPRNTFEYDLRKIGPQKTEARAAETLVGDRFGLSTWQHMASAESLAEAALLAEEFRRAPFVRSVEYLGDYLPLPGEQDARLAVIRKIASGINKKEQTAGFTWDEETRKEFIQEIRRLEWNLIETGDLSAASLGENSLPVRKRNALIREIFGAETGKPGEEVFSNLISAISSLPQEEAERRLSQLDDEFSAALGERAGRLASVRRHLTVTDLPEDVRRELVNDSGTKYLILIQGARELSGEENLLRFAEGLSAVHPGATGSLTLGVTLSQEILGEAGRSALIVAAVVLILVGLGIRSIPVTILTAAALSVSVLWMFGIYSFLGTFNIVNVLSLPLILGIGIDYCVHVACALREKNDPASAFRKTSKAVTLSTLTTVIGFGSLALAGQFKGIADLGTTLAVGIIACYITAVILLPALLSPAVLGRRINRNPTPQVCSFVPEAVETLPAREIQSTNKQGE